MHGLPYIPADRISGPNGPILMCFAPPQSKVHASIVEFEAHQCREKLSSKLWKAALGWNQPGARQIPSQQQQPAVDRVKLLS